MEYQQRAADYELRNFGGYLLQPAPHRCHFRSKNMKWKKKKPQMEKLFA